VRWHSDAGTFIVTFMVDHEQSIVRIAEREAEEEQIMKREWVVMLAHPCGRAR
jgi:hypothetical protein